jgi:hypothetical protein
LCGMVRRVDGQEGHASYPPLVTLATTASLHQTKDSRMVSFLLRLVLLVGFCIYLALPSVAWAAPDNPLLLNTGRLGNVYAPGQTAQVAVLTGEPSADWAILDFFGRKIAEGRTPSRQGLAVIRHEWKDAGWFELRVQTSPDAIARTTFVVIPELRRAGGEHRFGVMTHFAQGWDTDIVPLITRAGIRTVRDELYWHAVEPARGHYELPEQYQRYLTALKAHDLKLMLVLSFGNPLYDNGLTPYTDEGRQAFAAYSRFLVNSLRGQLSGIEVWNEFNGSFCKGPCEKDRPRHYAALLDATYHAVKQAVPDLSIAGGAAVLVPLPWFESLAAEGSFSAMDAAVVHPYSRSLEDVAISLRELRNLIRRHDGGRGMAIWATEFSRYSDRSDGRLQAALHLVRMAAVLLSEGVDRVYWYLLRDYAGFQSMGLLGKPDDPLGRYAPTPAYAAYAALIRNIGDARPTGRESSDLRTHIYGFGDTQGQLRLAWAADQPTRVVLDAPEDLTVTDIMGNSHLLKAQNGKATLVLNETPVYIRGRITGLSEPERTVLLADSHMDFSGDGAGRWTYGAILCDISEAAGLAEPTCLAEDGIWTLETLTWMYNAWSPAWRAHRYRDLALDRSMAHPSVYGDKQVWAVYRWRTDRAGQIRLKGSVSRTEQQGDGVGVLLMLNGKVLWRRHIGGGGAEGEAVFDVTVMVEPGQAIDFVVTPGPALDMNFDATEFNLRVETAGPLVSPVHYRWE